MKIFNGKSASEGVAVGKIYIYRKECECVKCKKILNTEEEICRFHRAKEDAIKQLRHIYEKALIEIGEENAAIFEMHQMLLEDRSYIEAIETLIKKESVNAEYAVETTGNSFAAVFAAMDDPYMRERGTDIKDVSGRILNVLNGTENKEIQIDEPIILVADDLTPSETVQFDKSKILAFVLAHGALNSHTAILARTMGIPALIGTDLPLNRVIAGKIGAVDTEEGKIYIEPEENILCELQNKRKLKYEEKKAFNFLKGKESKTIDGQKISLCANIGNINELDMVLQNDAEGIGLFRSEFLYLESETYPTEEEQFRIYRTLAETMGKKRVIVRTLDIGADKTADYFKLEKEANPAMGFRAIRICLKRQDMFKTQLRALYRASIYGNLAVMFPMITSVEEIRKIKKIVEEVKKELRDENQRYRNLELGVMIETPAAAIISDLLAKEVNFFSIGTNDLTQYLLAVDRQNDELDEFYNAYHPAVLRLIYLTVQNAHKEHIWCGICGELGADMKLTKQFLAMGVDELSVSPGKILPLRKIICESNIGEEKENVDTIYKM